MKNHYRWYTVGLLYTTHMLCMNQSSVEMTPRTSKIMDNLVIVIQNACATTHLSQLPSAIEQALTKYSINKVRSVIAAQTSYYEAHNTHDPWATTRTISVRKEAYAILAVKESNVQQREYTLSVDISFSDPRLIGDVPKITQTADVPEMKSSSKKQVSFAPLPQKEESSTNNQSPPASVGTLSSSSESLLQPPWYHRA